MISSIDLNIFKNKYFDNLIIVKNEIIYAKIRNTILVENYKDYIERTSIEILKLICDKVFFYRQNSSQNVNQSIKNMLYGNKVFYQDFNKGSMIESYLYRLINENVDRVLIFNGIYQNKNNINNITIENKIELLRNLDNDIIYLSDNIILLRNTVFLPWLWKCRENSFTNLKLLESRFSSYYLKNKWNFGYKPI